MSLPLLAENLGFAHPRAARPAFAGVSFDLRPGELLLLCGRNGAGKSSLLEVLAGLHEDRTGRLELFGREIPEKEIPPREIRRKIALLLQNADMQIFGDSVGEDLTLGLSAEEARAAPFLAARLGLPGPDTRIQELSYGQKRKLCLAAALLRRPEILLLDEPQAGLDYPAVKEFAGLLQDLLQAGTGVILSTHDPEPFLPLTENLLLLRPDGPPAYVAKNELGALAEAFGIRPSVPTPHGGER